MLEPVIVYIITIYIFGGFIIGFNGAIIFFDNLIIIIPSMIISLIISPITPIIVLIMIILNKFFGYYTWYNFIVDKYRNECKKVKYIKDELDNDIVVAKKKLKECEEKIKRINRIIFWIKTTKRICIGILVFLIFKLMLKK